VLLPFGYGQGTGQALNYGTIYETDWGFVGGKSFGLTIAALGFLSDSIGGVIHLNILKKKKKIHTMAGDEGAIVAEDIQQKDEIPMLGSMDKMTVQVAFVIISYLVAYLLMFVLGNLLPGMKSVIYGFNFLLGVLSATLVKAVLNLLRKSGLMHRQYLNDFLMTRISNFCFDIMVVAGIAAIRLGILELYWGPILILGVVGLVVTYLFDRVVAVRLFPEYAEEQFLMMYGMLTGTASTGTVLLREIDGEFKTPAADNMVYQNFPAIVFGFPLMLLATLAPKEPMLTLGLLFAFLCVMLVILFRAQIFKRKK
jgi:ESS family glutamate:Na+ symporter